MESSCPLQRRWRSPLRAARTRARPCTTSCCGRSGPKRDNHDMGFFDKLRDGLSRTKQQIVSRFEEIVETADRPEQRTRPVDVDTIEALEELLISADVGLAASERIIAAVRDRARHGESLRDLVKQEIRRIFDDVESSSVDGHQTHVTLIVGVNGTGKTTTIGKLANLLKSGGKTPLICAADT